MEAVKKIMEMRTKPLASTPEVPAGPQAEDNEGKRMAAHDIMSAIQGGDHEKLARAMGNFHDLHMATKGY